MEKNKQARNSNLDHSLGALPPELWQNILEYCYVIDLLDLRLVNRYFKSVSVNLLSRNLASFHSDIELHIDSIYILLIK